MDHSIALMEENHRKRDSVASTSKFGSVVQINSIAIDISTSVEVIESQKHEHFSIRGFVAGKRERDWKTCSPFASEANDVDLVDSLSPMYVPRFQWWQCSNCISDIETKRTTEEKVVATRNDAGTGSCHNVGDENILFLHSRENTGSKGKADARDKEAGTHCDTTEANPFQIRERLNNTTGDSDMVIAEQSPCIANEPDNATSGSDGIFSALPHRRKQKLRFLADIMLKEMYPVIENPRTGSGLSSGMQVTRTEMEAVLGPQPDLDVSADFVKDSTSAERTAYGEDGGLKEVIYPGASAKRVKGPIIGAGKICRRAEISDSDPDEDVSMRLDLRLDARTQRIKPKRTKTLDIGKKMRRIHREDGTAPMRHQFHQINAVCSANLQKHAPSTIGATGQGFRRFQYGQQIEKISTLSKSKASQVGAEHDPLIPPSKSILEDCNIREKVALDLSLNSFMDAERNSNNQTSFRQLPDLNEESPEKTAMTQGDQLTTLSEKKSLPLQTTLDDSAPCRIQTTREGKKQLRISELKNKEHNMELGGSDDIPMEIVELLARNQRERALEDSRRQMLGINNSTRGYSALYVDGRPSMIDFHHANIKKGLTVENGSMGERKNIPQLNNCRLDMNKPEVSQFRLFSSPAVSQQRKAQVAVSSSSMERLRSSTGAEILWSSTSENAPFHLGIAPKQSIQSSSMRVRPFSDRCHKGKTVRAVQIEAATNEGRMRPISTSIGSLDPYSNDAIPAMQLLSLMDQRDVSGSSFEEGTKSFLSKSFSPCNNHPRLNGKENHNFLSGSFFSLNSHSKDFSGLQYGPHCSGESSKKASSNLRVQIPQGYGNSKTTLLEGSSYLATRPAKTDSALGDCTLNQNPADFSIPDARNEFTLSAKDLKFKKWNASKEKSRMVNVEDRKRQRMRKNASGNKHSRK